MPDKVSTTRYNQAPKFFGKGRTRFDLSHSILTTGNTGDLIVTMCEPVVPGATISLRTSSLTRLETSLHQTLDNAYVETAYFFVPSRCLWKNFDKYQGFNQDAWARTLEFKKPQYCFYAATSDGKEETIPDFGDMVLPHSLINDLYAPIGKYNQIAYLDEKKYDQFFHVDLLPLRAVFKIYNEYFRDQNYDSELYWSDDGNDMCLYDESEVTESGVVFNSGYFEPSKGRLKVNRFKDVFSTALPQPQKGDPISVKLTSGSAPVGILNGSSSVFTFLGGTDTVSTAATAVGNFGQMSVTSDPGVKIVSDLSNQGISINDLRIAIALQSMRERDARSGNRLNEKLYGTWHIQANNLELDRAEYLGGKRIPVTMMEVLQTSETGNTVLGSDAGHSKTFDTDDSFVRTFTQWGYVIGFIWVRTSRSYSQGIDRKFFVQDILDEYDPMLDNISEQPIYKKELNAVLDPAGGGNTVAKGNKVFGYQEAWYQYKERLNRFSGMFQPEISGNIASWHYGDNYTDLNDKPAEVFAGPAWLKEGPENVDRTIAVASGASLASYQWMFNLHFVLYSTFEASKHSIPNTFGF